MVDVRLIEDLHLLLSRTHEEEPAGHKELVSVSEVSRRQERGLTKGGRYWKLLGSSSGSPRHGLSRSKKPISMPRVSPAAMRVETNTLGVMFEIISVCGCALMAYPVSRMVIAGTRFRRGRPRRSRLSHMPSKPA